MCLYLEDNWKEERKKYRNQKEPITVYKVLNNTEKGLFSTWDTYKWEPGVNISSRRFCWVGPLERYSREIWRGFHFFLSLADAEIEAGPWQRPRVVKCTVEPKHVVAVGIWIDGEPNLVATRATLAE